MRVILFCLLMASILASSSWAKDDKGGSAKAPSLPDYSKMYKPEEWKKHKWEIPGGKEKKKFELPQDYEMPYTDDIDVGEYGQKKFGHWWFSNSYPGDRCDLQQVAEGWHTIFLAFEPYVTYKVIAATPNKLSFYGAITAPSKGHSGCLRGLAAFHLRTAVGEDLRSSKSQGAEGHAASDESGEDHDREMDRWGRHPPERSLSADRFFGGVRRIVAPPMSIERLI